MKQIASKMLLNPDQAEVYKKRRDEIRDDLVVVLLKSEKYNRTNCF